MMVKYFLPVLLIFLPLTYFNCAPSNLSSVGNENSQVSGNLQLNLTELARAQNQTAKPARFVGVKAPVNIDASRIAPKGFAVHPLTVYNGSNLTTSVLLPSSEFKNKNIYSPTLFYDQNGGGHLIYGGWEDSLSLATDKIFQVDLTMNDLFQQRETKSYNRREILKSDFERDPTFYHINDPTLLDMGNCHLRLFFEVESINLDYRTTATVDPKSFQRPPLGSSGYTTMTIAYADSIDCGKNWNNGQPVTRKNFVKINGLTGNDYWNYQFGWPVTLKINGLYYMYFTAAACPERSSIHEKSFLDVVRGTSNMHCSGSAPAGQQSAYRFGAHSVLYATSTDGLDFTYQGLLVLSNGQPVWGLDDVRPVLGSSTLLAVGPGATIKKDIVSDPLELIASTDHSVDPWGKFIGYIDPSQPNRLQFFHPNEVDSSINVLMNRPSPIDSQREPISVKIATRRDGSLIGFLYGEWRNPDASNSLIGGSLVQRRVEVIGQVNGSGPMVSVGFNTAISENELLVSYAHKMDQAPWVTHTGTQSFPPIHGTVRLFEYDGRLLCESHNQIIHPGATYAINCEERQSPAPGPSPSPTPTPTPSPTPTTPPTPNPGASVVTVAYPINGAANTDSNPTISWNYAGSGTEFFIDLSESSTFSWFWNKYASGQSRSISYKNGSDWGTIGAVPYAAPNQLAPGKTYYLRIVPFKGGAPIVGEASTVVRFSIPVNNPAPGSPSVQVTSPSNGATNVAGNPSISWTYAGVGTEFFIDLSESSTFSWFWNRYASGQSRFISYGNGSGWGQVGSVPYPAPSQLVPGKTYYLRIVPFKDGTPVSAEESSVIRFTIPRP